MFYLKCENKIICKNNIFCTVAYPKKIEGMFKKEIKSIQKILSCTVDRLSSTKLLKNTHFLIKFTQKIINKQYNIIEIFCRKHSTFKEYEKYLFGRLYIYILTNNTEKSDYLNIFLLRAYVIFHSYIIFNKKNIHLLPDIFENMKQYYETDHIIYFKNNTVIINDKDDICYFNSSFSYDELIFIVELIKKRVEKLHTDIRYCTLLYSYLTILKHLYRLNIFKDNSLFCILHLNRNIDIYRELQALKSEKQSYLNFPFIFNTSLKGEYLKMKYEREQKFALQDIFFRALYEGINSPYFILKINRNSFFDDTIFQFKNNNCNFKKQLRIEFENEDGVDSGGLTKDYFLLMSDYIKNNNTIFTEKNNCIWFKITDKNIQKVSKSLLFENEQYQFYNKSKNEIIEDEYRVIGNLMGLCLYNNNVLNIPLPPVFFKLLLENYDFTLEDLAIIDPTMAKSLNNLLEGDILDELKIPFSITFSQNNFDYVKSHKSHKYITNENINEYINFYLNYILFDSIESVISKIQCGFYEIIEKKDIYFLNHSDLEIFITGTQNISLAFLRKNMKYVDYDENHYIIKWLWSILKEFTEDEIKNFIEFITGNSKVPINNIKQWHITIYKNGNDTNLLPTARTCFNILLLPEYKNREKLKIKLKLAIKNYKGFFLV